MDSLQGIVRIHSRGKVQNRDEGQRNTGNNPRGLRGVENSLLGASEARGGHTPALGGGWTQGAVRLCRKLMIWLSCPSPDTAWSFSEVPWRQPQKEKPRF